MWKVAARFYGVLCSVGRSSIPRRGRRAATSLLNSMARIPRASVNRLSRMVRQRPATWNTCIAVRDIDQAVARVEQREAESQATFERQRGRPNSVLRGHGRRTVPFVASREAAWSPNGQHARRVELQ